MINPLLEPLHPAGVAYVLDWGPVITVAVPGDSQQRLLHVLDVLQAVAKELDKRGHVETFHVYDEDDYPYIQGVVRAPWRRKRDMGMSQPYIAAKEHLEQLGYAVDGQVLFQQDDRPFELERVYKPERPPGQGRYQVGDRVVVEGRAGTLFEPCLPSPWTGEPGICCKVRLDLRPRERNPRRHEVQAEEATLHPEPSPPPRLVVLRKLLEQGVPRATRRAIEQELLALGTLPPPVPPLRELPPPRTAAALTGQIWRTMRQAPPAGVDLAYLDGWFERHYFDLVAVMQAAVGDLSNVTRTFRVPPTPPPGKS